MVAEQSGLNLPLSPFTCSHFNANSAGSAICADSDESVKASILFGKLGIASCAVAKAHLDSNFIDCDMDLFTAFGVSEVGDGTLQSICPMSCNLCGPGGTFIAAGYRLFRGLATTTTPSSVVAGSIFADRVTLRVTGTHFAGGDADIGRELYLTDMPLWKLLDTKFDPFDTHNSVATLRSPLAGCAEHPCSPGYGCAYHNYTLECTKCAPNLASVDGLRCRSCGDGYGPADNGTRCDTCTQGLYSKIPTDPRLVCAECPPGKQTNVFRDDCQSCGLGTYSPDGTDCRPCPPGMEPDFYF
jgi:hypothetical protein